MKPPVFIVGCPRSGTSFLYQLLLAAGGFAEFHTQMNAYDVMDPIYRPLDSENNRRRLMGDWLQSKAFQASGLNAREIEEEIVRNCRSVRDFMASVMGAIARNQGVDRWADSTPTNAPHMLRIAEDFPDAIFLHMIRDPRDIALSLARKGWARPLPWDKKNGLLAAGLYWEWIVRTTRQHGRQLASRYMEVRYEALVQEPREMLPRLAEFLGQDLNYVRMQEAKSQSAATPLQALTSFSEDLKQGEFSPVGRWKQKFPPEQLQRFEDLIGDYMAELGYARATQRGRNSLFVVRKRAMYSAFYPMKQWIKIHTPLSRMFVNYAEIQFDK